MYHSLSLGFRTLKFLFSPLLFFNRSGKLDASLAYSPTTRTSGTAMIA